MAPELYNESYDQTVDIYAFGMCMLEIFTKEIPYRECSNPAQIYKKVTSGVEPASLDRIQSAEARDFIRQCFGTPDGQGGYLRPSATELLKHSFLAKNDDDGSEVLVIPPEREVETSEGTVLSTLTDTTALQPFQRRQSRKDMQAESERSVQPTVGGDVVDVENNSNQIHQPNNADVGLSDEFVGLPDCESNIKNVKVMIGRGQHIDEEETSDKATLPASNSSQSLPQTQIEPITHPMAHIPKPIQQSIQQTLQPQILSSQAIPISTNPQSIQQSPNTTQPQNQAQINSTPAPSRPPIAPAPTYVVSDIVELAPLSDNSGMPYDDDILRLRIKLAVDNPDNQVQFDFHLVNDDPVAVAQEMVSELHLPNEAVLEISQTISRKARDARMRQDQFKKQNLMPQHQQQQGIPSHSANIQDANMSLTTNAPIQNGTQTHAYNATVEQQQQQQQQQGIPGHSGSTQDAHMSLTTSMPVQNGTRTHAYNAALEQQQQQKDAALQVDNSNAMANTTTLQEQYHTNVNANNPEATVAVAPSNVLNQHEEVQAHPSQLLDGIEEIPADRAMSNFDFSNEMDVDIDDDSTSNSSEIKKLKSDFENKVSRAERAYKTRMENLRRSKEEKEELHKKTVEKHNKEKLAFEKRVMQAAKEQKERVQKLTKEFEEQKAKALKSKHRLEQDEIMTDPEADVVEASMEKRIRSGTIVANPDEAKKLTPPSDGNATTSIR